jgi:hypothetical protein
VPGSGTEGLSGNARGKKLEAAEPLAATWPKWDFQTAKSASLIVAVSPPSGGPPEGVQFVEVLHSPPDELFQVNGIAIACVAIATTDTNPRTSSVGILLDTDVLPERRNDLDRHT